MKSGKCIVICEEQLDRILREELCSYTADRAGDDFKGFVDGLKLTLELADVAEKIINRLFHEEEEDDETN